MSRKPNIKIKDAIQEAIDYGIDISLLYESLSLMPTERIGKNQEMLEVAEELKKAGERKHGKFQKNTDCSKKT